MNGACAKARIRVLRLMGGSFVLALVLVLVLSAVASAQSFTDVTGDEWFAEAVEALAADGIVSGRADGSFGPSEPVTRAQLAALLARTLHLQDSADVPFADVTTQDWFAGAVGALYQTGIVSGTASDTFSPNLPVSRQQAATFVIRALSYFLQNQPEAGVDYGFEYVLADVWLAGFQDRLLIGADHAPSVANAYRLGIMEGTAEGWFYPALTLTRAQMAAILYRAFLQPIDGKEAYPEEVPAVSYYPSLSSGSEGPLVSLLESRLTTLCFPCGPVDGVYDYRTKDAVMAFQKAERLSRDGQVGPEVWQRLFVAQTPAPRLADGGDRFEVDLGRQILLMIRDGRVDKVLHVSTGKLGTPTGYCKVRSKTQGWTHCPVGWMYSPSYIMPHIAIHGYRSVPSYPASHGCVRVPVWTADELYGELPLGLPGYVYY
jgi:peptidoglycan hydrolase-like protein with peptidoglycan-binding domain